MKNIEESEFPLYYHEISGCGVHVYTLSKCYRITPPVNHPDSIDN